MDQEWTKAVAQLCIIMQNDADLRSAILRYIEIMGAEYRLDKEGFLKLYDEWKQSGEIQEKYRQAERSRSVHHEFPLYHRATDGMCRMLDEEIIDEATFFDILWEIQYEILKEENSCTGYYPNLPGCIGIASDEEELKEKMQAALQKWIRNAYIMWRENNILGE